MTARGPVELATGAVVLSGAHADLFLHVDRAFAALAAEVGADNVVPAGLVADKLLERIDYFRNFPHLGLGTYRFAPDALDGLAQGDRPGGPPIKPTGDFLPSATCYSVFGALDGQELDAPRTYSAVGRCYRNEAAYDGLSRLHSFTMREIVYVGDAPGADAFRARFQERVLALASRWGVPLQRQAASDPFFLKDSRALLTALDPVKWELVDDAGVAVASLNKHRNFFGERLGITVAGDHAVTSCTAFGLERWVGALTRVHGTPSDALHHLTTARTEEAV
ncbi:hypothetical protein [Dactylosporangium sp. CA-233914]|uniref:hypothetical protein n=1 Tax=Dactylosporangium sp. CA-233914 TaxID=3239934 RepID=UPI003D92F33A